MQSDGWEGDALAQPSATGAATRLAANTPLSLQRDAQEHLIARVRAMLGPRARRAGESLDFAQQAWLELLEQDSRNAAARGASDEQGLLRRLCAIARNNARDAARRKGVLRLESVFAPGDVLASAPEQHAQDLLAAPDSSPSLRLARREELERFEQRVGALEPRLRAVFELRAREGLSFPQIAARLARQEDTVRKAYYRAVQALQRLDS